MHVKVLASRKNSVRNSHFWKKGIFWNSILARSQYFNRGISGSTWSLLYIGLPKIEKPVLKSSDFHIFEIKKWLLEKNGFLALFCSPIFLGARGQLIFFIKFCHLLYPDITKHAKNPCFFMYIARKWHVYWTKNSSQTQKIPFSCHIKVAVLAPKTISDYFVSVYGIFGYNYRDILNTLTKF